MHTEAFDYYSRRLEAYISLMTKKLKFINSTGYMTAPTTLTVQITSYHSLLQPTTKSWQESDEPLVAVR